ncbi:hypothetical protein LOTGIDRAFT_162095 [Lottia gigantea]|uniref:Uncharacterized protein n=1 Tax=Lottia gigantea TaxID=225164 RepID=V4A8K1_LOTGI|nr:hypothetical protein LOTGIDRAFT_162095 [Lottia gigantea]ESO93072.1 hypothetical protein LOTGIDRAFT_162095 [Lottia gigantea]
MSGLKYCRHGDMDTIRAPYVEECSTGKQTPSKNFVNRKKDFENDPSSAMDNMISTNKKKRDSNDTSTTFCYRFEYSISESHDLSYVHTQKNANFSCDHNSLCKEDGALLNVTLNGEPGKLFCCSDKDECNKPSDVAIVAPLLCYNGNNTQDSKIVSCKDPDDVCAVSTIIIGDQVRKAYYCDNQRCLDSGITKFVGSYEKCKNITFSDNVTEELCCCVHSRCNKPHSLFIKDKPGNESPNYSSVKVLVIGIVGGVMLSLVFSFIVYVFVKRHFNKMKLLRDNAQAVRMSYKEISADDVSNSETAHILNI